MSQNGSIKKITYEEALQFYKKTITKKDQLSLTDKGDFFGYFDSIENFKLLGIISVQDIGESKRVKSLLVDIRSRNAGVGSLLLLAVTIEQKKYTAFATNFSINLFKKNGFIEVSKSKNNISFMLRSKNV